MEGQKRPGGQGHLAADVRVHSFPSTHRQSIPLGIAVDSAAVVGQHVGEDGRVLVGRHRIVESTWRIIERSEGNGRLRRVACRSEEHTSELQSLMRNSYAVFCLKQTTKHVWRGSA